MKTSILPTMALALKVDWLDAYLWTPHVISARSLMCLLRAGRGAECGQDQI